MDFQAQVNPSAMLADSLHVVIWNTLEILGNNSEIYVAFIVGPAFHRRPEKIGVLDIYAVLAQEVEEHL